MRTPVAELRDKVAAFRVAAAAALAALYARLDHRAATSSGRELLQLLLEHLARRLQSMILHCSSIFNANVGSSSVTSSTEYMSTNCKLLDYQLNIQFVVAFTIVV
jgi:hypothetical protein